MYFLISKTSNEKQSERNMVLRALQSKMGGKTISSLCIRFNTGIENVLRTSRSGLGRKNASLCFQFNTGIRNSSLNFRLVREIGKRIRFFFNFGLKICFGIRIRNIQLWEFRIRKETNILTERFFFSFVNSALESESETFSSGNSESEKKRLLLDLKN
ncbi:hypothetical protein C1645_734164 [Glomus cerebriforme]|uniref:Uncharacterized protein n=1 Tax=Glomus cerebriforme TaxID=658196 RepID=A0A397TAL3_9GLOM|nr:hypothetical protein C1645_734164 [Glomus cerebriforme]